MNFWYQHAQVNISLHSTRFQELTRNFCTLWWTYKKQWKITIIVNGKMAIEIGDFPIKNGGSFHCKLLVHQRVMLILEKDLPWSQVQHEFGIQTTSIYIIYNVLQF